MRSCQTLCSRDAPAERDAAVEAAAHLFQRALGPADGAHAVMDAARPEAALRDLEAAPLAEHDAVERHAHIREADLAMPVRRIVIAEHRQHALLLDARACPSARAAWIAACGGSGLFGSVLPITIRILQRLSPAPDVHHLRPLMT